MIDLPRVAVLGASGYSGEELVRLLSRHPGVELAALTSRQHVGTPLAAVYPRFAGGRYAGLPFIDSSVAGIVASGSTVALLALPHGVAAEFAVPLLESGLRVIDLSADFRIKDPAVYEEFYGEEPHAPALAAEAVYGLVEDRREAIRGARLVACPGCYPTSILLPLLPLVRAGLLELGGISVASSSGVSGAGRTVKQDYLFVECNESVRAYGVPKHRHLAEVEQELTAAAGERVVITFTPHLVPISRGIHTVTVAPLRPGVEPTAVGAALEGAYAGERFVRLLPPPGLPDTKHVAGTNCVDIAWRHDPRTGRVVLLSAEDNLVKGAAGQAVQCLNLLLGLPEAMGLE